MGLALGGVARVGFRRLKTMGVQVGPRSQNGNSSADGLSQQGLFDHEAKPGPRLAGGATCRAGRYRIAKAHASVKGLADISLYLGSEVSTETLPGMECFLGRTPGMVPTGRGVGPRASVR